VIAGVGQLSRRPEHAGGQSDPCELITGALRLAAEDSGGGERLLGRIQSLRAPMILSWRYGDPAALVAERLGLRPAETVGANIGGDTPQVLVNDAADAIAAGKLDVAAVAGGEAVHTVRVAHREGVTLDWPTDGSGGTPTRVIGPGRPATSPAELEVELAAPLTIYAFLENAIRHRLGRTVEEHQRRLGELWAGFSAVAAQNPNAWSREPLSPEQIAQPSRENRPVTLPYTKLMNANPIVDQAAAVIVCSLAAARDAGVPAERCVFLHAGAEATDEWFLSQRAELDASPPIRAVGRAILESAGCAIDEVAHIDLYSCFPSAVEVAARELGLGTRPDHPLTVTGGLAFAGGPGNNYVTHALARMVEVLREDPEATGLTTGVGWWMTKHAAGLMSGRPPRDGYRRTELGVVRDAAVRAAVVGEAGVGTAESCTVIYGRDGSRALGIASALLDDGRRALAKVTDDESIAMLSGDGFLGRPVQIEQPGGGDALLRSPTD
jgi:acetyl-CoA C-acetyltransferase